MGFWGRKTASTSLIVYLWISVIGVLTLFSCSEPIERLPYFNTPDFTPHFIQNENEVTEKITHTIDDFKFKNHLNQDVTHENIKGKIHVADFMFTSCGSICPKMTNNMKLVSDAFLDDDEVMLLSYSVTPWSDSVKRLNEYVYDKKIKDPNWFFLTGSKSEIYDLARQSYFAEEDIGFTKDSTEFLHTEHFILVDENQRIRGIYNGTLLVDVKQLIADIHILKKES
ncbi:SCO family protein [bacterium SCSIO 12643]|nr:SCO family protein [bacterium SCSIO 12643]